MNSVLPNPSSKGKDGEKPKQVETNPGVDQFAHFVVNRLEDGELDRLGMGAMGVTYRALDTQLDRLVALKTIHPQWVDDPEVRSRFSREARAAARLQHPNIASVLFQGEEASVCFYVMELVVGENLHHYIRRVGPLSPVHALKMVHQIALALIAAEKEHIVHRDLKPANIMVTTYSDGGEPHLKVIDFGLAKLALDSPATFSTGGFIGTPEFASPEQCEEKPLDARSDIYSMGGVLWFLLTAATPFSGSLIAVIRAQINSPPDWSKLPHAPAPLLTILGRLMAKNRDFRPATALDAAREIDQTIQILSQDRKNFYPLGTDPGESGPEASMRAVSQGRISYPGAEALKGSKSGESPNAWIVPAAVSICCFATGIYVWNSMQKHRAEAQQAAPGQAENASASSSVPTAPPVIPAATPAPAPVPASREIAQSTPIPAINAVPPPPTQRQVRTDFVNSLGMKFIRPYNARIMASVWETRVRDFEVFAAQSTTLTAVAKDGTHASWRNPGFKQSADDPVVFVSPPDAIAFCHWLTEKERRAGVLASYQRYRLPNRLEWDQLLTGQYVTSPPPGAFAPPPGMVPFGNPAPPTNSPFLWGSFNWPAPANFANLGAGAYGVSSPATAGDGYANTSPVGTFEPNIYGLFDMIGNAAEMCSDGPEATNVYIAVGGSWQSSTQNELRMQHPKQIVGGQRDATIGFRCVIDDQ